MSEATSANSMVLKLLLSIEWEGDDTHYICPSCRQSQQHGHAADCDLARRIEEARK